MESPHISWRMRRSDSRAFLGVEDVHSIELLDRIEEKRYANIVVWFVYSWMICSWQAIDIIKHGGQTVRLLVKRLAFLRTPNGSVSSTSTLPTTSNGNLANGFPPNHQPGNQYPGSNIYAQGPGATQGMSQPPRSAYGGGGVGSQMSNPANSLAFNNHGSPHLRYGGGDQTDPSRQNYGSGGGGGNTGGIPSYGWCEKPTNSSQSKNMRFTPWIYANCNDIQNWKNCLKKTSLYLHISFLGSMSLWLERWNFLSVNLWIRYVIFTRRSFNDPWFCVLSLATFSVFFALVFFLVQPTWLIRHGYDRLLKVRA